MTVSAVLPARSASAPLTRQEKRSKPQNQRTSIVKTGVAPLSICMNEIERWT